MASRKQEIYRELLTDSISYCRNLASGSPISRAFNKSSLVELQFVHNIPVSILQPDFVEHDIWFLNHQAKQFVFKADESSTPNYSKYRRQIIELLSLLDEKQLAEIDPDMRKLIL